VRSGKGLVAPGFFFPGRAGLGGAGAARRTGRSLPRPRPGAIETADLHGAWRGQPRAQVRPGPQDRTAAGSPCRSTTLSASGTAGTGGVA